MENKIGLVLDFFILIFNVIRWNNVYKFFKLKKVLFNFIFKFLFKYKDKKNLIRKNLRNLIFMSFL